MKDWSLSDKTLWNLWLDIKSVCSDQTNINYPDVGGRKIEIYGPWKHDPGLFITYINNTLGPCPAGFTLARVDINRNFEPENLKWKKGGSLFRGKKKPGRARSSHRKGISWDEEKRKWEAVYYKHKKSKHLGYYVTEQEAIDALNLHFCGGREKEEATYQLIDGQHHRVLTHNCITLSIDKWSIKLGLPITTIRHRLEKGLTTEEVLTPREVIKEPEYDPEYEETLIPVDDFCLYSAREVMEQCLLKHRLYYEDAIDVAVSLWRARGDRFLAEVEDRQFMQWDISEADKAQLAVLFPDDDDEEWVSDYRCRMPDIMNEEETNDFLEAAERERGDTEFQDLWKAEPELNGLAKSS